MKERIAKSKIVQIILFVLISVCFVVGMNFSFVSEQIFNYRVIFNILMFAFSMSALMLSVRVPKEIKKSAFIFGLLFSIMLVIGQGVYETNIVSVFFRPLRNVLNTAIMFVGYVCVSSAVSALLIDLLVRAKKNRKRELWRIYQIPHVFYLIWLLIFISWIPVFLAYYPGIFTYDMPMQTTEAVQGIAFYTKFQPPLHTLIWAFCLKLASIMEFEAISIYAILQMIVLSFALAKLIVFFIEKNINNFLILFTFIFVTMNPVVAIFSVVAVKDVYFAIFFILTNILLSKLVSNPKEFFSEKKNNLFLILSIFLSCMFRNNAIYAFILLGLIYFLVYKMERRHIILVFSAPIIIYFLVTGFVFGALGIQEGNSREMLSVPIQQISNVMATEHDDFPEELIEEVDRFIPYRTINYYNPRFADPVKLTFKTEQFNENKIKFMKLWSKLLIKYPDNYISAFLNLNIPYWYIDAKAVDVYSEREYIETENHISEEYPIQLDSKWPELYLRYEEVADFSAFEDGYISSRLFSLALPIWILIFTIFVLLAKKKKKGILLVLPSIVYWSTFLLGPVSNLRYIFPLIILIPFYLILIFESDKMIEI